MFLTCCYVLVNLPPEQLTSVTCLVFERLLKLLPSPVGPFWIILTTLDIVTVDKDGVHNKVSINRVTRVRDETDATNETDETKISKRLREPPTSGKIEQ